MVTIVPREKVFSHGQTEAIFKARLASNRQSLCKSLKKKGVATMIRWSGEQRNRRDLAKEVHTATQRKLNLGEHHGGRADKSST